MIVQKLKKKIGQGVVSNHVKYLKENGYNIFNIFLDLCENMDFEFYIPVLNSDTKIYHNFTYDQIKKFKNEHEKIAIYIQSYDENKNRIPFIKKMIENEVNSFNLRENDIIFLDVEDGFDV